jgi:hypothetical protein
MERSTRELPENDLVALHYLVAVTEGHLVGGELPPHLTQAVIKGLTDRGLLPPDSSPGDLTALLSDLGQRLHWAMGAGADYPAPMVHRTTHNLELPHERVAESIEELVRLGGQDIEVRPSTSQRGEQVSVSFAGLPPDSDYQDRVTQLTALAESHGGQYAGAGF